MTAHSTIQTRISNRPTVFLLTITVLQFWKVTMFNTQAMEGGITVGAELKLIPTDADENMIIASHSISGNYAILGASNDDDAGRHSGSAYIFKKDSSSGAWSQEAKLLASDAGAGDEFGHSVSIDGDTAIVGARNDNGAAIESGSAYIFERNTASGTWSQVTKITAADGGSRDLFGISVSISGDYAIVGAMWDDDAGRNAGAAYMFEKDAISGRWIQVTKIIGSDTARGDGFGSSVAIFGVHAIVGAPNDRDAGENSGSAYVFERDSASGAWIQVQKLTATDADEFHNFGNSVFISGHQTIVGSASDDHAGLLSGSAYIFEKDSDTGTWLQAAKIIASDPDGSDHFGESVSISDDYAVVGAPGNDDSGSASGSSYLFAKDSYTGTWSQVAKLVASDATRGSFFGSSVAISVNQILIGRSAYIYEIITEDDLENIPPIANDDGIETNPGQSIVIDVADNDSDPDGVIDPLSVDVIEPRYVASFDGINDKITWGKLGIHQTPMISKFIRFRTTDTHGVLFDTEFGGGADGGLYLGGGMLRLRCAFNDADVQTMDIATADAAADGTWHSAGFSYDGSTLTAYFDGAVMGTPLAVPGDTIRHNYPTTCGGRALSSSGFFFSGELSDFVVYNAAVSSDDVLNYHNALVPTTGLVLWGTMDEDNYTDGLLDFSGQRCWVFHDKYARIRGLRASIAGLQEVSISMESLSHLRN